MTRPSSTAITTTSQRHGHLPDKQPPTLSPLSPISPWPPVISSPIPSRAHSPSSTGIPASDFGEINDKGTSKDTTAYVHSHERTKDDLPNATDVYSSIAILTTYSLFFLYIYWAIAPEEWTRWLPDRQWALIVPCYLMIIVLLTYWSYAALNLYRTPDFSSPSLMTDPYSGIPVPSFNNMNSREKRETPYYWKYANSNAVPEAVDLPIDLVGRVLYPQPLEAYEVSRK